MRLLRWMVGIFAAALLPGTALAQQQPPLPPGVQVFPADNPWNWDIGGHAVHPKSAAYVSSIGTVADPRLDFSFEMNYVPGSQPKVPIAFVEYPDESDPGPGFGSPPGGATVGMYPFPPGARIEPSGDAHCLVIDIDNKLLYETYHTVGGPPWTAGNGAVFDLRSNALRPDGWTSGDAAGLPIFPGVLRYEEILAGEIKHALRVTVPTSQNAYLYPATHHAGTADVNKPPMGLRLRLKQSFDLSSFTGAPLIILRALKKYGLIVADNGPAWWISTTIDDRWQATDPYVNEVVGGLRQLRGSDFEAVVTVDGSGNPIPPAASPSIVTSVSGVQVPEGATATFQVKLSAAPSANLTVAVSRASGDADLSVSAGAARTFTPLNWNTYQTVTLSAAEDGDTSDGTAVIRCSSAGLAAKDVAATEVDNDAVVAPTVTVSASDPTASEPGVDTGAFLFTRSGSTASSLTVSFTRSGTATSGSDFAAIGTSVVIPAGSATAVKTVTPIDDTAVEGNETVVVTLPSGSATVTIQDNDAVPALGTGLYGEYYDAADLTAYRAARVDPVIDFNWAGGSPHPLVGPETFSVLWMGKVQAQFNETYTFYVRSDDGVRLRVRGRTVIDQWVDQGVTESIGTISMRAGRKSDLWLEYYENTGNAEVELSWSSPSQPRQVIPMARLYPLFDLRNNDGDGEVNSKDPDDDNDGIDDEDDSDRDGDGIDNDAEDLAGSDPDDRTSPGTGGGGSGGSSGGGGSGGGCGATGMEMVLGLLGIRLLRRRSERAGFGGK